MYKTIYFLLAILQTSNIWGSDKGYNDLSSTLLPPSPLTTGTDYKVLEEEFLTNKKSEIVDVTNLSNPVIKTLVDTYSGLEVTTRKLELTFFQRLFSSLTSQKFLCTTEVKDQAGNPYLLKDIEFYQAILKPPLRSVCANFWTYKPWNKSQEAALEEGKKFAEASEGKAAGIFIHGNESLGKTSLAFAIAKACFETHKKVLYFDANPAFDTMGKYWFNLIELEKINFNMVIIDNFICLHYPQVFKVIIKGIQDRKGKIIIASKLPYEDFFNTIILPCYQNHDQCEARDPNIEDIKNLFQEIQLNADKN